jgi:hypothetical protein
MFAYKLTLACVGVRLRVVCTYWRRNISSTFYSELAGDRWKVCVLCLAEICWEFITEIVCNCNWLTVALSEGSSWYTCFPHLQTEALAASETLCFNFINRRWMKSNERRVLRNAILLYYGLNQFFSWLDSPRGPRPPPRRGFEVTFN